MRSYDMHRQVYTHLSISDRVWVAIDSCKIIWFILLCASIDTGYVEELLSRTLHCIQGGGITRTTTARFYRKERGKIETNNYGSKYNSSLSRCYVVDQLKLHSATPKNTYMQSYASHLILLAPHYTAS